MRAISDTDSRAGSVEYTPISVRTLATVVPVRSATAATGSPASQAARPADPSVPYRLRGHLAWTGHPHLARVLLSLLARAAAYNRS